MKRRLAKTGMILWSAVLGLILMAACAPRTLEQTVSPVATGSEAGEKAEASTAAISVTPSAPSASQETVIETTLPTNIPQPTLNPGPELLPQPPGNRTRYTLEARLDYARHSLSVQERIVYTNTTLDRLHSITLVVEAQRYPGVFRELKIYDREAKRFFQFRLSDTVLVINLPQELQPGETTQFFLTYTLQLLDINELPLLRPYPLGYTDLQANFGDWYPFIPPYAEGKGWLAHPAAFYGEHLVYDVADFEVAIQLEGEQRDLVVAASMPAEGEPSPEAPEQGVPTAGGSEVAATAAGAVSTPGTEEGEWLRYQGEAKRSFAFSVSPYYEVITQTKTIAGGSRITLASYYFPYHAEAGKSLLDTMAKALEVYTKLFGGFPQASLSGVQADFMDGMEYDGLYFLSTDYYNWHREKQEDFLIALAAHETAHQWWYGLVGNDQALEPWLDEAVCTYSEMLYYENVYPQALEWWWTYRVNYYQPEGWVNISIYDSPQVVNQYRAYRNPVYLRGALFLEELRRLIGEEAFFGALRDYANRFAYRQANGVEFFEILRQHTTRDIEAVVRKYFQKTE